MFGNSLLEEITQSKKAATFSFFNLLNKLLMNICCKIDEIINSFQNCSNQNYFVYYLSLGGLKVSNCPKEELKQVHREKHYSLWLQ